MDIQLILYKIRKYQNKLNQNKFYQNTLEQFNKKIIYKQKINFYLNILEGGRKSVEQIEEEKIQKNQYITDKFKEICTPDICNESIIQELQYIDPFTPGSYITLLKKCFKLDSNTHDTNLINIFNTNLNIFLDFLEDIKTKQLEINMYDSYVHDIYNKTLRYLKSFPYFEKNKKTKPRLNRASRVYKNRYDIRYSS
jgi:hypothetical protein